MASRRDDSFEPKLRPPKSRGGSTARFVSRVLQAASRAGPRAQGALLTGRRSKGALRGRGAVAARMLGRRPALSSRRVAVKTRLLRLQEVGRQSTAAHVRYLEREGVTPTGEPGRAYGAITDEADTEAFDARGADDRHQFRVIVSPEDGTELQDLKTYTRALMARMETDLGTRLDWVAVDHWDTGHPHTHVIIRGVEQGGENLVIARDYIAYGMRARASELATDWLGPRSQREIDASLAREMTQNRWTSLDAALHRQMHAGEVDLTATALDRDEVTTRTRLVGRLKHLEALGLAVPRGENRWSVSPEAPEILRSMAERGDIIRTMQRALGRDPGAYDIFDSKDSSRSLVGRIAAKGLHGEEHDRGYLVIEGLDGRGHYVALAKDVHLGSLPMGAVVEVRGAAVRAADRMIAANARDGIYRADQHRAQLNRDPRYVRTADALVRAHVRRLEALRRVGIVERVSEGVWKVPADLSDRGRTHDLKQLGGATVDVRCHLPIERQIRAKGATWLDQHLVEGLTVRQATTVGTEIEAALRAREEVLMARGLARRTSAGVVLNPQLLKTLRERELAHAAQRFERSSRLLYRPTIDGVRTVGTYRESIQLTSGRFALLDDGVGFSLVPWRPVLDKRLGQQVSATVDGTRVNWEFGRSRSRSL